MRTSLRFVLCMAWLAATLPALAQVRVSITVGPPPLPVYEQPLCPGDGYLWTPGYWAWDGFAGGYYWVPGTWILPPRVGLLWTPGYWAWRDASFAFVDGYWGPVVGFYGGIDYGFGYTGHGYYGGRWTNGRFFYNRSVSNVNVTVVRNVYIENVRVVNSANRVSYNGGRDGIAERPTASEAAAARRPHVSATTAQVQHVERARSTPDLHATANQGKPPVAATERPQALQRRSTDATARESPARESSRDRPSNARNTERPQPRSAPPQTRPDQSSASESSRAIENGRAPQSGRVEQRSAEPRAEPRSPPATGRAQSGDDRPRDQQGSKTRQGKKRDKAQEEG